MEQLVEIMEKIMSIKIVDIAIAIGIIIFFRIFSGSISYIIIRMFKWKEKNRKKIKESAFYKPLKTFFIVLGFYMAIVFLKFPLQIKDELMIWVTKIFKIISVIGICKRTCK